MSREVNVCGAHLVGSVPYEDTTEVFTEVSSALGAYLRRIPDGETGARTNWVDWQLPRLAENPNLELVSNDAYEYTQVKQLNIKADADSKNLQLAESGYAQVALESYEQFKELKTTTETATHCKFQVCLPTPLATTHLYVVPELQADFEAQYETSILEDLDTILHEIPHSDLAIQWDTAVEFALLEGVMPTYIEDLNEGILLRLVRLGNHVPDSVEMGYHLCYGDSQHKHFCEPENTEKLVAIANGIAGGLNRPLNWVHLPVPRNRTDKAYYAPLANLSLHESTELYLGLVHHTDGEEGTRKRIESASHFVSNFGVATECGFGRRPRDTLSELMKIHRDVSESIL